MIGGSMPPLAGCAYLGLIGIPLSTSSITERYFAFVLFPTNEGNAMANAGGRPKAPLILSPDERLYLEQVRRRRVAVRYLSAAV